MLPRLIRTTFFGSSAPKSRACWRRESRRGRRSIAFNLGSSRIFKSHYPSGRSTAASLICFPVPRHRSPAAGGREESRRTHPGAVPRHVRRPGDESEGVEIRKVFRCGRRRPKRIQSKQRSVRLGNAIHNGKWPIQRPHDRYVVSRSGFARTDGNRQISAAPWRPLFCQVFGQACRSRNGLCFRQQ